jgi:hypothetical protein
LRQRRLPNGHRPRRENLFSLQAQQTAVRSLDGGSKAEPRKCVALSSVPNGGDPVKDYVIDFMIANGILLTVANYCEINYGSPLKLDDLLGEYHAEVEGLIEEGILVETDSRHKN